MPICIEVAAVNRKKIEPLARLLVTGKEQRIKIDSLESAG